MKHRIHLTGPTKDYKAFADKLKNFEWLEVRPHAKSGQLALDPGSVSLIVGGLGSVNALIGAIAVVWAAKVSARLKSPPLGGPSLNLQTDIGEVVVNIDLHGKILSTSSALPKKLTDITNIVLIEPSRKMQG